MKPYKEQKSKGQDVGEPMIAYDCVGRNAEGYLEAVPRDVMQALVDSAIEDYEMGHCISQSQMDSWIKKRMGWK